MTTSRSNGRGRCVYRGVRSGQPRFRRLPQGLAAVHRFTASWVYVAVCNMNGVFSLCSGLNNEDGRQSAPLTEILHCTSTRHASYAKRGGGHELPQQRTREKCICAAPANANPVLQLFTAGDPLAARTQPALNTGIKAPAWRLLKLPEELFLT